MTKPYGLESSPLSEARNGIQMMMLKFFIVFIMKKKNSYKKKPNKDGPWQDIKTWHEAVMHNVLDFRTKLSLRYQDNSGFFAPQLTT